VKGNIGMPITGERIFEIFRGLEAGDGAAFFEQVADDVDWKVNREEISIPPKIIIEMAKGFTLFMVKAVMNGRADEVLDMAVTNLWR